VVLPLREYEELLEDLHDLTVLHERRDEQPVAADEFERKLRDDGLVWPRLQAFRQTRLRATSQRHAGDS
jgi:hypothetical protein